MPFHLRNSPTAPTAAANTNTTQIATTAFVTSAVSSATIATLDEIGDVAVTGVSSGQFLKWNGSNWVNDAIDLSTDTTGDYVSSLVAGTGVSLSNNSGENATPTIAIGQAVATNSNVQFADITATGTMTITGETIIGPAAIANKTAAYTLALADQGKIIEMSVGSAVQLTVPPNSSVAFPIGTQINIVQYGVGKVEVLQGAGVTVRGTPGLFLRAQYSSAALIKRATNEWYLVGDLSAS